MRSRGRPFQYPECRQEMILPSRGVAGLQPAFFVERMKDVCSEAEGKVGTLTNVLKSTVTLVSDMASMGDSLVLEEAKVDSEKEELCRSIQQSFKMLKASLEAVLDQRKAELE